MTGFGDSRPTFPPVRFLLAADKFKGSLSARGVCAAYAAGLRQRYPTAEIRQLPLADGGDGTLALLGEYLDLREVSVATADPVGRPLAAAYLTDGRRAFVELASASGHALLTAAERNPMRTSTAGTGALVQHAIASGAREVHLLLGGSATNDCGLGIAHVLGVRFYGGDGRELGAPVGKTLRDVHAVTLPTEPTWAGVELVLWCDVDNPAYGPRGAARAYGPQKGASAAEVALLDEGVRKVCALLREATGVETATLPGAGAAGAIGVGLVALCGARLRPGFATVAELVGLREAVSWADAVVTGEGQLDGSSFAGKVVGGVLDLCGALGTDIHLVVGRDARARGLPPPTPYLRSVTTVLDAADGEAARAMSETAALLTDLGRRGPYGPAPHPIFVYGLLRRGMSAGLDAWLGRGRATYLAEATLPGHLYDLGEYPGLVRAPNRSGGARVRGELWRVDDPNVWPVIDDFEGIGPDYPVPTLYRRVLAQAQTAEGEAVTCWVYLYNRSVEAHPHVLSGDWAAH